jgi:hypothetical protein
MPVGFLRCTLSAGDGFQPQEVTSVRPIMAGQYSGWAWVDFNGDRKLDFCRIGAVTKNSKDPYGSPTTKTVPVPVCSFFTGVSFFDRVLPAAEDFDPGSAFGRGWVDFNGDGLPDYCRVISVNPDNPISQVEFLQCSISDGTGFVAEKRSAPLDSTRPVTLEPSEPSDERAGRMWVDFNGDGYADFCRSVGHERADQPGERGEVQRHPRCTLSTGSEFGLEYDFPNHEPDQVWQRRWADANGDGLLDFCYVGNGESTKRAARCTLATMPYPDLLTRVSNGLGGDTSITYIPSSQFKNSCLSYVLQTVGSITTADGRGHAEKTAYSYEGGYFNAQAREFRGFQHVTQADVTASTADHKITETWFHQGNGLSPDADDPSSEAGFMKGKPYRVQVADGDNTFLEKTTLEYKASSKVSPPYFNPVRRSSVDRCEDGSCKTIKEITADYDDFGMRLFNMRLDLTPPGGPTAH